MKMCLTAIKDIAVGLFMKPVPVNSTVEAQRAFMTESVNPKSQINMYPTDLSLWYLGDIDMETGIVTNQECMKCLMQAVDAIRLQQESGNKSRDLFNARMTKQEEEESAWGDDA